MALDDPFPFPFPPSPYYLSDDDYHTAMASIDAALSAPPGTPQTLNFAAPDASAAAAAPVAPAPFPMPGDDALVAASSEQALPSPSPESLPVPDRGPAPIPALPPAGLSAPPIPAPKPREMDQYDADAVSGVDALPLPSNWNREHGGYAIDKLKPEVSFDDQVEGLDWIAQNDPEAYARLQGKQMLAEREKRAELEEAAAREERARAADHEKRSAAAWQRAEARAEEIESEAKALASERVDPERWWSSRSTGQKIAGYIAATIGGLVQHQNGGRNVGLEMINAEIDRDIDAQKANLANKRSDLTMRRGLVADLFARTGDLDRAAETARVAARTRALGDLERELGQYDIRGKTAFTIVNSLKAGRSEMEADRLKRTAENQRRQMEKDKFDLEVAKAEEGERNNRAQNRASLTSAGATYLTAKTNAKKTEAEIKALEAENAPVSTDELRRLYPNAPKEAFAIGPVSLKKFEKHIETLGKVAGGVKAQADAEKAARENDPANRGAGDLVTNEGKVLEFVDDQARTRIVKKRGAVDNGVRIIDQMIVSIQKNGWSPDVAKSPEWQAVQSDAASLVIQLKNDAELGVLAGPDMGLLDKMSGGDPTQVRDPVAALKQARANLVNNFNGDLASSARPGSKPKRYEPPKIESAKAEERTLQQNIDAWEPEALKNPSVPIESKKEAAVAALESVDAIARQAASEAPELLKVLAKQNARRATEGLVTQAESNKAQKTIRKYFQRHINDLTTARNFEELAQLGYNPADQYAAKSKDAYLDHLLLGDGE